MASLILGVMGKKRAGKDTFAAHLVAEHGFTRLAFADALKDVLLDLDPMVDIDAWDGDPLRLSALLDLTRDWEGAKQLPEVRRLLQALGVAARTHVKESIWVDAVMNKAAYIPGPVVITDVRFPNEADIIQRAHGKLVRVVRPGQVSDDTHVSETALDDRRPDFHVTNAGTVADLHTRADVLADLLLGPTS